MKKLIADIYRKPDGRMRRRYYCRGADGELDFSVGDTLLILLSQSNRESSAELGSLVSVAEAGEYVPDDPSLPDWGVNDKNVWLVPPMAEPGHICIANEYSDKYFSDEGGRPQQFTYAQFRIALDHWNQFESLLDDIGLAPEGRCYECDFPD